jgi:hypothetical protein
MSEMRMTQMLVEAPIIRAICALTSDKATLAIAEFFKMKIMFRRTASRFLQHYLAGTGSPVTVNIADLLRDDPKLKNTLMNAIIAELRQSPLRADGSIPLQQYHYGSADWELALGAINMRWKVLGRDLSLGKVTLELNFQNQYRWHPGPVAIRSASIRRLSDSRSKAPRTF